MIKKLLLALLLLVVLFIGATWFFISGTLKVAAAVKVNCNSQAAFRTIAADSTWSRWGEPETTQHADGNRYTITKTMFNGFDILIDAGQKQYHSSMLIIPVKKDSTIINWELTVAASSNPLQRIADYREAATLQKSMAHIAVNIQNYLSIFENVYGFRLQESTVTDTFFISTKAVSPVYPGTDFIYTMVNKLKAFCASQGCTAAGSPMLNITRLDSAHYQVKTALPVNRAMLGKEDVTTGKMVPGKFIVTEVTGGMHKVETTLENIHNYFRDYGRMSMAIPFSYLITDRQQQPDSSKWVTRIYAPVY